MNIQDILNKVDGEMLVGPGLTAMCTEVGQRKTGTNANGEWSLQILVLKDNSGQVRLIAWNRDNLANLKGQEIIVSSYKGDKGWAGCSIEDKEYNGKKYKQIKLSSNGELILSMSPTTSAQSSNDGGRPVATNGVSFVDYIDAVRRFHQLATELEPDDATARAALVNTDKIAFTNGKIYFPDSEKEELEYEAEHGQTKGEAGDDIPF